MMETVRQRYGIPVEIVFPEASEVESMIAAHGPNLFYREVPLRKLCCEIRKVRPMQRKLATLEAWVVGLRRSQTETRSQIRKVESRDGTVKISPLADWSAQQVEDYTRQHDKECGIHVAPNGRVARRVDVLLSDVLANPSVFSPPGLFPNSAETP
jgi:3'-phosphoadenosine 5'-phosphosulfate sulfotransferase (PAPS reductase)/FAD synthetase